MLYIVSLICRYMHFIHAADRIPHKPQSAQLFLSRTLEISEDTELTEE